MIRVSQSLIRKVVNNGFEAKACPKYLLEVMINKNYQDASSLAMLRGMYFESKLIGSTANGEHDVVLPLAKGKPSAVQKRIDQQVETGLKVAKEMDIDLAFAQTTIRIPFNDKYYFEGVADIFPTVVNGELCIVDLKLTQLLSASFGEYAWGFEGEKEDPMCDMVDIIPNQIDTIQSNLYLMMAKSKQVTFEHNNTPLPIPHIPTAFIYWVFEHNRRLRWRMFYTYLTLDKEQETRERVRFALYELNQYKREGWKPRPTKQNCKQCPINCKERWMK